MSDTLKLWFFRDITDDQRLKLFGLFGLPVEEIGSNHGRQSIALRHITQKLVEMVRDETSPPAQTHVQGVDIQRLPIGTPVEKVGGYPFPGTVVAAFHTLEGNERFVVEATGEAYRGMLHIFNGGQLRVATAAEDGR